MKKSSSKLSIPPTLWRDNQRQWACVKGGEHKSDLQQGGKWIRKFIPETRWCISEWEIVIFNKEPVDSVANIKSNYVRWSPSIKLCRHQRACKRLIHTSLSEETDVKQIQLFETMLFAGTDYNKFQLSITYPELFKFCKMANILNHFNSVWCNIECC